VRGESELSQVSQLTFDTFQPKDTNLQDLKSGLASGLNGGSLAIYGGYKGFIEENGKHRQPLIKRNLIAMIAMKLFNTIEHQKDSFRGGFLHNLAVWPAYRDKDYAKKIVQNVSKYYSKRVLVTTTDNPISASVFEHAGFQKIEEPKPEDPLILKFPELLPFLLHSKKPGVNWYIKRPLPKTEIENPFKK
jgi:ribosomal protein S18 acetylase RimI-like enzyme